jgi:hypothetical protein
MSRKIAPATAAPQKRSFPCSLSPATKPGCSSRYDGEVYTAGETAVLLRLPFKLMSLPRAGLSSPQYIGSCLGLGSSGYKTLLVTIRKTKRPSIRTEQHPT